MEWRAFLVSVTSNKRVMELLDGRNVLGRGRVLHVDDITCSRSQGTASSSSRRSYAHRPDIVCIDMHDAVEIHVDRPNQRLTIKRVRYRDRRHLERHRASEH